MSVRLSEGLHPTAAQRLQVCRRTPDAARLLQPLPPHVRFFFLTHKSLQPTVEKGHAAPERAFDSQVTGAGSTRRRGVPGPRTDLPGSPLHPERPLRVLRSHV